MNEDGELLRCYAVEGSEAAFEKLIRRHVGLVYCAALRLVNGDTHRAQDVTQQVFAEFARQANRLMRHPAPVGWLYTTTRLTALRTMRTERRRSAREQEASIMNELLREPAPEPDWVQMRPVLEHAMHELGKKDRHAVLLRFFQNKSLKEVGAALDLGEKAAQMRVERALHKLRIKLIHRGITTTAAALSAVISANAVQVVPAGLAETITAAILLAGSGVQTTTIIATTKTIAMTSLQKSLIAAVITAAVGMGIYEARQATNLRSKVQNLEGQQSSFADESERLARTRENEAARRLAALREENEGLRKHSTELLRLRGEVGRLRRDIRELAQAADASDPFVKKALKWKANEAKLRQLFEDRPAQRVPQMQLLNDEDWLDLARDEDLESEAGIRKAFSDVRRSAENTFINELSDALKKFAEANGQKLPDSLVQLKPYFEPPVDDSMLGQYKLLHTGKVSDVPSGEWAVTENTLVDEEYDTRWGIGPNGFGPMPPSQQTAAALMNQLTPAIKAFTDANNGTGPTEIAQLKPYLQTAAQKEAAERLDRMGGYLDTR